MKLSTRLALLQLSLLQTDYLYFRQLKHRSISRIPYPAISSFTSSSLLADMTSQNSPSTQDNLPSHTTQDAKQILPFQLTNALSHVHSFVTNFPVPALRHHLKFLLPHLRVVIQTIPSNPPRQLHILLHNRHSLRMYRQQIRVFEQMHQIRLGSFLQRHQCL